jgi:hypothetical protein
MTTRRQMALSLRKEGVHLPTMTFCHGNVQMIVRTIPTNFIMLVKDRVMTAK